MTKRCVRVRARAPVRPSVYLYIYMYVCLALDSVVSARPILLFSKLYSPRCLRLSAATIARRVRHVGDGMAYRRVPHEGTTSVYPYICLLPSLPRLLPLASSRHAPLRSDNQALARLSVTVPRRASKMAVDEWLADCRPDPGATTRPAPGTRPRRRGTTGNDASAGPARPHSLSPLSLPRPPSFFLFFDLSLSLPPSRPRSIRKSRVPAYRSLPLRGRRRSRAAALYTRPIPLSGERNSSRVRFPECASRARAIDDGVRGVGET